MPIARLPFGLTTRSSMPLGCLVMPLLGVASVVFLGSGVGCSSGPAPAPGGDEFLNEEPRTKTAAERAAEVEDLYIVGPQAARRIEYTIEWQERTPGKMVRELATDGSSVFAYDSANRVSRITDDGVRLWSVPLLDDIRDVYGMTYLPAEDRLSLTTGSEMTVLDGADGSYVDRQSFGVFAATPPVEHGQFLIFGSRDGKLIWWRWQVGSTWKAYRVGQAVDVPPAYSGGYVVCAGNDGSVSCLRASDATRVWRKETLGSVVASPAAGQGAAFVASTDQHLRAYSLGSDRTPLWEYLTESALTESPVVIDDRVYQSIPTEGIVCFEARPEDQPGGVVIWSSPDASGTVLTRNDDVLLVWDGAKRQFHTLDTRFGTIIDTVPAPDVSMVFADAPVGGTIFAAGTDGRVTRLRPKAD